MGRLRDMVRRLGPAGVSVLVPGPTGTGQELVAGTLHACSSRTAGLFVPIHCGALPAELLESELFGHLQGSFSGAHRDQPGLVEAANRGTLFLDEVGEMPPAMQVKLLRFLQDATFLPVGGRVMKRADVRVVAATHHDLETMVAAGEFREDLFYRLKGMVLRTPSLAERADDIPLLAALFLHRSAPVLTLAADAAAWLTQRTWPGNVREPGALVEAASALAPPGSAAVDAALLQFVSGDTNAAAAGGAAPNGPLASVIADVETRMLREALLAAGGNRSKAARALGVPGSD
jgi:two-component system NtrC family response regulator